MKRGLAVILCCGAVASLVWLFRSPQQVRFELACRTVEFTFKIVDELRGCLHLTAPVLYGHGYTEELSQ